jgi:hypothetical protein
MNNNDNDIYVAAQSKTTSATVKTAAYTPHTQTDPTFLMNWATNETEPINSPGT